MYFDAHAHCCLEHGYPMPYKGGFYRMVTAEELIELHDKLGVSRSTLMPEVNPEGCPQVQSNEEIIRIAKHYPERFVPFCNVDPRFITNSWDAPLEGMIKYYRDCGCKGVGEVQANLEMLDPKMQNLFKATEAAGMPLTFHMSVCTNFEYGIVDYEGLPQMEICLQRFPKLNFIGHSQAFWAEIAKTYSSADRLGYPEGPVKEEGAIPRLMRKYPNLYGDLSANSGRNALTRDRAYGVKFLNEFQDRLMFGLDICDYNEGMTRKPLVDFLESVKASGEISLEVYEKVTHKNVERLLGL